MPGAGRKKGQQNPATKLRTNRAAEFAQRAYDAGAVDKALAKLLQLVDSGDTPQVQLAAAREILDRTLGKPTAPIEAEINHEAFGLMEILDEIVKRHGPDWDTE